MQSFPLTLNRVPGSDFRLPTDAELDALEAFQLFLGRDVDIDLAAINFKSPVVARGRDLFNTTSSGGGVVAAGKCNLCHLNAGASFALGPPGQNRNFNTGVENLPDQPADLIDPTNNPPDDGFGNSPDPLVNPAVGTFNTPPVVEAADTGPHFHNNSVDTIEAAVGFYNGDTFANSPAGNFLAALDGGVAIDLEATQVVAIAALLRVLNALENIRSAEEFLAFVLTNLGDDDDDDDDDDGDDPRAARSLLSLAIAEVDDAIEVLDCGGLHPRAQQNLRTAQELLTKKKKKFRVRNEVIQQGLDALERARGNLIED